MGTIDLRNEELNSVVSDLATKLDKNNGPTYDVNAIVALTAAEYAAIVTPDANTLYFIV